MSRELNRAHNLLAMLNTVGWQVEVKELAEQIVCAAEREALDCEDDAKAARLRYIAQAERKFWESLKQRIQSSTQIENLTVSD